MMPRLAIVAAAILAGFAGGYLVGIGNLESLQLRMQQVEDELRRTVRELDELEAVRPNRQPPNLHYVPPEE